MHICMHMTLFFLIICDITLSRLTASVDLVGEKINSYTRLDKFINNDWVSVSVWKYWINLANNIVNNRNAGSLHYVLNNMDKIPKIDMWLNANLKIIGNGIR